tara:strand:+ start:122 stop:913 length:792 start_codon:yes stop_codon:yes gene_type:complete
MASKKPAKKAKKGPKTTNRSAFKHGGNGAVSPAARVLKLRQLLGGANHSEYLVQLALGYELVNDAVTITEPEHNRLVYVNPAWEELYGFEASEVLGRTVTFMNLKGISAKLLESIAAKTNRDGWEGSLLNQNKAGDVFSIRLRTMPLKNERGDIIGLLGVSHQTEGRAVEVGKSRRLSLRVPNTNGHARKPRRDWKASLAELTPRELEVFTLLGKGLDTKQIGELLEMSLFTVQTHRNHLKVKLKLGSVTELNYVSYQWVSHR